MLYFWFPTALPEYLTGGSELSGKVHTLLELFKQSKSGDTGSTGDAEEYKRESKTVVFAGALFAQQAILSWSLTVNIWFV